MKIRTLNELDASNNQKLENIHSQLINLINELNSRDIPGQIALEIDKEIESLNSISQPHYELLKSMRKSKTKILRLLEKKLKIVVRNHYRNLWMVLGMPSFGLPIGVSFGLALDNIGLLGIGLPIGMIIGMAVGSSMDKKAAAKGNQLSF